MKTHATPGADAIEQVKRDVEISVVFLILAEEIVRWHREKWTRVRTASPCAPAQADVARISAARRSSAAGSSRSAA